ncbi:Hypothetical protein PHPALM_695 [Phytophthora palmivora]|uniref:ATP-binding cassette (ABC) Superfamily n=1 Tax=Phytophthora palmivora TaxID=4796 RepID=A0A2P4YU82_9STRA|nr:Hypothetical protein PHPALM_695 [Phytophthora palmivora]
MSKSAKACQMFMGSHVNLLKMPKKASTHGASALSKSKTARSKTAKAKSKDKAAPRKEVRKAASEAGSKRTAAAAAKQGGSPRRLARAPCRPTIGRTLESPVFDIPMITGSESDGDSPGSTKDPSSSQDAPSQDAPVDDAESSEAKAASTSSPAKNLTLTEGKARAQAAKAASPKRAGEGAAAAKKRAAPGSPTSEPSIAKGFKSLFDSSDEEEEEGLSLSPKRSPIISMYSRNAIKLLNYKALLRLPRRCIPMDTIHRMRGLGLQCSWSTSRPLVVLTMGALHVAPMSLPQFKLNHSLCVLLAPHRISLKEFASLRKKPEDRGELFPVWGYPSVQPKNTITQTQAEDLFWRWVSLKNFTVQELKELREDRLLSYVLDLRDLRIEFAHLIAKRQLHSVMEGLRQQSKSSAQDERGYGSVNPGTVHRKAAKKPWTTYAPAVADPKSQRHPGSQPGAGLPAPTSSVTRGQEELSHAFEYEAPYQPYPSGPPTSGRDAMGSLLCDEVRQLRDRVYAIEIALGLGPGGQAAAQAVKPGTLEVLRQDLDALGRETHEPHGRVDR